MVKNRIERIEELRLDAITEKAIADLLELCFPTDFGGRTFYQNRHHCRFVIWDGETVIGHLAVAYRSIRMGEQLVDVAGIAEVGVHPDHRKQGIGGVLVAAALEEGKTAGADFAILFGEHRIYEDAGFTLHHNAITFTRMVAAQSQMTATEQKPHFRVKPLADMEWDGNVPVDLAGFPF